MAKLDLHCVGAILLIGLIVSPLCTSAAYLYVSFHGGDKGSGINNVYRYNLDGSNVQTVLQNDSGLYELRGMAILSDGSFLVANAYKSNTALVQFSKCMNFAGTRNYVGTFTHTMASNPALVHTYGLIVGPDGNVYASNQDSNTVTRYYGITSPNAGQPIPVPASLQGQANGTIVALNPNLNGVRGIAFDSQGLLYVADEDTGVGIYNPSNGARVGSISVTSPIGLAFEPSTGNLYISLKQNSVVTYSTRSKSLTSLVFTSSKLGHPAGIAIDTTNTRLYVASQDDMAIHVYNSVSGASLGHIVNNLADVPEALLLSPC